MSSIARTQPLLLKELDFTNELPEGNVEMGHWRLTFRTEVILQVFRHCSAEDLAQASQVCKEWHRFTSDDQVWKEIYLRNWKKMDTNLALDMQPRTKSSWKEMYIERSVIENLCFPRKKSIFSADSVQGLMYKASKLIGMDDFIPFVTILILSSTEKAQNFNSSPFASRGLSQPITPFALLAVAAESYEACYVLENERKQQALAKGQASNSEDEKEEEAKEEADKKLEADIMWRWGLTLIKQAAFLPDEEQEERERLLDLGSDKCESSLYLHDNLKMRLKLADRFLKRATEKKGGDEARFIYLFKKARAHYRLALQIIEDEESGHEQGNSQEGSAAADEEFDELLGVKKRNFSLEKAKAYRQLGWAYFSEVDNLSVRGQSVLEMLKASRDCYKYSLDYEPESVESFKQLGKVLSLMGKIIEDKEEADAVLEEALTYYKTSIMYNGKDADLLNQVSVPANCND